MTMYHDIPQHEIPLAIRREVGRLESANRKALAENELLRAALEACASWIDRWTKHVGACEGGDKCTCGRTAVLYEARNVEQKANHD